MKAVIAIFLALFFGLQNSTAFAGDDNGKHGKKRMWGDEWNEEFRDGPCEVKVEGKDGEYKRKIKCKDGIGANWSGEWKREFWDGPCKVKQEAKGDEFKEEVKCEQ